MAYADESNAPDIAALAAAYCVGLAKSHAFVDGNKRAAFLATGLFLYLNVYRLTATQASASLKVLAVAASEFSEAEFGKWLRLNISPRQT